MFKSSIFTARILPALFILGLIGTVVLSFPGIIPNHQKTPNTKLNTNQKTTQETKLLYGNETVNSIFDEKTVKQSTETNKEITKQSESDIMTKKMITIETNKGNIKIELFVKDAPKTTQNFIDLVNKSFYDGIIFHRVISGFMIQGGDPTGTGRGGPGYKFEDELNPNTESYKAGYVRGIVAMANSGPNTNGSQFFIMHKDTPLPHNYTIFGKVIEGMNVVDAIAESKVDGNDKPLEDIIMNKVYETK